MENLNDNNLQSQILRTIVWFDLFSQPLTAWEIYKYLNYPTSYNKVSKAEITLL